MRAAWTAAALASALVPCPARADVFSFNYSGQAFATSPTGNIVMNGQSGTFDLPLETAVQVPTEDIQLITDDTLDPPTGDYSSSFNYQISMRNLTTNSETQTVSMSHSAQIHDGVTVYPFFPVVFTLPRNDYYLNAAGNTVHFNDGTSVDIWANGLPGDGWNYNNDPGTRSFTYNDILTFHGRPTPQIGALSPSSGPIGANIAVTFSGSNIYPGITQAYIFGAGIPSGPYPVSYHSPGDPYVITMPSAPYGQTVAVRLYNPAPGGGVAPTDGSFTYINPAASVSGIAPSSVIVGAPGALLTITGGTFVPGAVVVWNSPAGVIDLAPAMLTPGQITVNIPAAYLAVAGTVYYGVINPGPGGGQANDMVFTINPLPPDVTSQTSIVITSGPTYNLITHIWSITFKITNTGGAAIPGPLQLFFDNPSPGLTAINATGTNSGSQYITIPVVSLAPAASVSQTAQFTYTGPGPGFTFTKRVLAGPIY
jgi:hypothetical protein